VDDLAVYANLPQKLDQELSRCRIVFPLYLSQVTDPLQPVPEVLKTTFQVIRVILKYRLSFHIVTRSAQGVYHLIEEIPELRRYPYWFAELTVEATPEKQRVTSPGAPPIQERLEALRWLHDSGIETVGRTDPTILGLIEREDLEWLIRELKHSGVSHIIGSTGYFNPVSMGRLLKSVKRSPWSKSGGEIAQVYGFAQKDMGSYPQNKIFRAPWHSRVRFHQWLRSRVEKLGMSYAVCQELPREYDSSGIPTCEGIAKNFVHIRSGQGFEPIDCFGDCLRNCPNPEAPPCGNPDLLTHYPYRLRDLRPLTAKEGFLF
jgi:DNA repair photolyase